MAAERLSLDCTPSQAPTIDALLRRLGEAAASVPEGGWLRATGFDEALVADRRAPTRDELDGAVPDAPLVLHHRTGHAELRNTAAGNGPTPPFDPAELATALGAVSAELEQRGVVEVHDATPSTVGAYRVLARHSRDGVIRQRVMAMPSVLELDAFADAGLEQGSGDDGCRLGPAKVLLPAGDIAAAVDAAHRRGWRVAVHVTDIDDLAAALGVVGAGDRLEHLALCLPEQVAQVAASGVAVVTQPSFLVHRRAKYLEQLSEVERSWLYRVRSFLDAGVEVHLSSDAPVVPADPEEIVRAAVERDINPTEAVDADTARRLMAPPP